jgi:Trypsin-like peptidase domain
MTRIDQFSLTTTPIEQHFNQTLLGTATGFVWNIADKYYLVTNWHVVTCRIFPSGENISPHGGRPNMLRVWFNLATQEFWKQQYDIRIRDQNDETPLWLVHPARKVDIAVVPLPLSADQLKILNLYPINKLTSSDLAVYIGMEVFILGFPFGVRLPAYPIWKRGSIASEPDLAPLADGFLMVDTASRPGMSGAPVIVRSWTNHLMQDGTNRPLDATTRTRFMGVYSGRIKAKNNLDTQIGMVWPATAINEIIACNMRDQD